MQETKASTVDTTIDPPADTYQIEMAMVDSGGVIELQWNGQIGDEVDLRYTGQGWSPARNVVIWIWMLKDWTIDRDSITNPQFVFTQLEPQLWQIEAPSGVILEAFLFGPQPEVFHFLHVSGRRSDPRIIVEREN